MNKNIKIEIAVGIILIVGIIIGGIFWLQNKKQIPNSITPVAKNPITQPITQPEPSDETVNWQTYKNDKYGFEIKFPSTLNYNENEIPKSVQESAAKGDGYLGPEVFNFLISEKAQQQEVDRGIGITVIKRENNNPILDPQIIEEEIWISGQRWLKYSGSFYIANDGYIYSVYSFGEDKYYDGLLKKVLSTFKFVDSTSDDIAKWKIYRSDKYGFEVKLQEECNITETNHISPFYAKVDVKNCMTPSIEIARKDTFKGSGIYLGPNQPFKSYWDYGTDIVFGTNTWRKINYTESNQEFCWYVIQDKNNDYAIRWSSCTVPNMTLEFNTMLSTFKFKE